MRLLLDFLRACPMALVPLPCALTAAAVGLLYGLPACAALYALLLALVIWLAALLMAFLHYRRRRSIYERLLRAPELCIQGLPEPKFPQEREMQALLRAALRERDDALSHSEAHHAEQVGYYTLWAHQIKTPLAAMRLMLAERDDAQARELRLELARVERYVEMALCYLRLDGSQTDYVFSRVALEPLVRACVRRFAPQFIHKHLHLELEPLPGEVLTDEKWLSFVIEQLLSNAVKYTPPGGAVHICLSAPGVLLLEDTGVGISAQDLPRIFEQGFTGRNGRVDKHASGIGLALSARVMGRLGHTISCESTPGQGTRMTLDLRSHALERE